MMQVFGDSPRYCSRELTFMGLLPAVSENEALTGLEFTAFIDNIEDRQRLDAALEAREKLKIEAQQRLDALDRRLDEQAVVSEKRLNELGIAAEAEVRKAAGELVPLTVSKLIGLEVSSDEVSQAIQAASEGR